MLLSTSPSFSLSTDADIEEKPKEWESRRKLLFLGRVEGKEEEREKKEDERDGESEIKEERETPPATRANDK